MLYFLFGENSFEALKKIQEVKKAFFSAKGGSILGGKKNPNFLFEEIDGENEGAYQDFVKLVEEQSLFNPKRLMVFKNIVSIIPNPKKFFLTHINFLRDSKDIFLFWERDMTKEDKVFEFFYKNATKTQEVKAEKILPTPKDNSVFRFVDRIFASSGAEALLHLENATSYGVDGKSLTNIIFWKTKKAPKKDKNILNIAHQAILTDLNLKMDKKNEKEHLSRLAIRVALKA
ncbi:MAG TPA: hypothetical protein VJH05_01660 [Candidatus Paceibacterota bacterium]